MIDRESLFLLVSIQRGVVHMAASRELNRRLKRALFGNDVEDAREVLEEGADVNTRIEYMAVGT